VERYESMVRRYGQTARTALDCGMHVHVSIVSPEEGVQILDRMRPWLAVLVALSSNSSVANGADTGHASHRTLEWYQWPCAGPYDAFGSLDAYLAHEDSLLDSGVLLDKGMLSLDARLSREHPTVEIRVADVCSDRNHALAIAALARALVETAGREAAAGVPPRDIASAVLRLASWQAALTGVQGDLVDPTTGRPRPAHAVVASLLKHVREALDDAGDLEFVEETLDELLAYGTGADRARFVMAATSDPAAVVSAALEQTHDNALVLTRQRY
jgi:carboxylate-amine ligase